jgi:hypothetical protein
LHRQLLGAIREKYQDSLSDPRFPEIMTKFAAFTDVEPIRQFDEVLSGDG